MLGFFSMSSLNKNKVESHLLALIFELECSNRIFSMLNMLFYSFFFLLGCACGVQYVNSDERLIVYNRLTFIIINYSLSILLCLFCLAGEAIMSCDCLCRFNCNIGKYYIHAYIHTCLCVYVRIHIYTYTYTYKISI